MRKLYENIMKSVSKEVKRSLNEMTIDDDRNSSRRPRKPFGPRVPEDIATKNEYTKVWLAYEGDQYLSNLVLMGIYTDKNTAIEDIANNHRFDWYEFIEDVSNYTPEECDEIVRDEIRKQLKREAQVTGDEIGYVIKDAELNVWEEIN